MVKKIMAVFVSVLPLNILRIIGYRLMGYDIDFASRIGFLTIISVKSVTIRKSRIGTFNWFIGPALINIQEAKILKNNRFICPNWVLDESNVGGFKSSCTINPKCLITIGHFFDLSGEFVLEEQAWVGGMGSQFWTHGMERKSERFIKVGKNAYIGSGVMVGPGVIIQDHVVVALGSVVTKGTNTAFNAVIGGNPAKVIKEQENLKALNQV